MNLLRFRLRTQMIALVLVAAVMPFGVVAVKEYQKYQYFQASFRYQDSAKSWEKYVGNALAQIDAGSQRPDLQEEVRRGAEHCQYWNEKARRYRTAAESSSPKRPEEPPLPK